MKNWIQNLKKRRYIISILIFIVGFLIGSFAVIIYDGSNSQLPSFIETRASNKQFTYINPLLECNAGSDISNGLQSFKDKIQNEINQLISSKNATFVSIYFRDMDNGPWFGINADEQFIPASLLKVPVMMSYFKEAESDSNILNKEISFIKPSNQDTPYFKTDTIVPGKTYTVNELIKFMIVNSDNEATNLLLENTTANNLNDVFNNLYTGISVTNPSLTVQQYGTFFRILFNASYLNDDDSEKALALLSESTFTQGLVAGVPQNIKIAHKYGERWDYNSSSKQLHDCGIVYYPKHPYLLCVMTRGTDFGQLASVIADISKTVYNEVDRQLNN